MLTPESKMAPTPLEISAVSDAPAPGQQIDFRDDSEIPGHDCGVMVELSTHEDLTYFEAAASTVPIQNRGSQAFGGVILSNVTGNFEGHKAPGSIREVIRSMKDEAAQRMARLAGRIIMTHVRWSTDPRDQTPAQKAASIQPYENRDYAAAVNGNVENAYLMAIDRGISLAECPTDSIAQVKVVEHDTNKTGSIVDALKIQREEAGGGYAIVASKGGKTYGMRDPNGIKPLSIAQKPNGNYVFASETVVFDAQDARFIRDVAPGEIVEARKGEKGQTLKSYPMKEKVQEAFCALEIGYFMRAKSLFRGLPVAYWRGQMGKQLAKEVKISNPADYVVAGVPESGLNAAEAFAAAADIQYIKPFDKIVDERSFTAASAKEQQLIAEKKLDIDAEMIHSALRDEATNTYKTLILADDSAVKGNQMRKLVERLQKLGVPGENISVMIPFPEIVESCHLGSAIEKEKLLSYQRSYEEQIDYLGVNSLTYLSIAGFKEVVPSTCGGCFGDNYPVPPLARKDRELIGNLVA